MPDLREFVLVKETMTASTNGMNNTEQEDEECPMLVEANTNNTEEYFTSYDNVEVHRLMVRDQARTDAYRKAILDNRHLFEGNTVMDVGAGTGILSLFAKQAGAKKVYAVEASGMVEVLREIVKLNDEDGVIEVIHGKAEDVDLEGGVKVDIMISEWMGFYLLHESMLDSVIMAREKHLDEDGLMFPSHARILAAPCVMEQWVQEQFSDWSQVYGFNMTPMAQKAMETRLGSGQPEILSLEGSNLLAQPEEVMLLDLRWVGKEEVSRYTDRKFVSITKSGSLHGLAVWFEVTFRPAVYDEDVAAKITEVVLGTGPRDPKTHWKQTVLLLLGQGIGEVEEDEVIGWELTMEQSSTNPRQYAISLELLDPASEEHPVPCSCNMAKCALMKAIMDKEDEDMRQLEEIS